MQHTLNFFFLTGCIAASLAHAAGDDTTKIYKGQEVVVTATRSAIAPEDAPAQVRLISSEEIQRINGTTAADILQIVDGVNIRDYGATGGVKTISTRGLLSANITILLNGNPINDPQNGIVDLALLPLSSIDRVEFVSGGASALYGGNATGGVVNLITRKASQDLHASVKGDIGSFGARNEAFELGGRFDSIGMVAGISHESGSDDFPFLYHRINAADTTLNRTNADYNRTLTYWNGDYRPSNDITVNSFIQYVKFERGDPGSLAFPSADARLSDETFRATLGTTCQLEENISATMNANVNHNLENSRDTSNATDLSYRSFYWMLNAQCEWKPISWDRVVGGAEYGENTLEANGISFGFPFIMNPVRIQKSVYLSNECRLENESDWFNLVVLYQTLREDYYSDVKDDALSPKLGANIRINEQYNVHIRSSWGQDFRVPTFNDLYYPNYNNPSLSPERSTAFDVGVLGSIDQTGRQTLEITYFNIAAKDKIVNGTFGPYNIGQAESSGLDVRYDYNSIDNRFDAYAGFSFVDARKKDKISETDSTYNKYLSFVPLASGVLGLSFETEIGRVSINEIYTGLRYVDYENVNSSFLPAYAITNVNFSKTFPLSSTKLTVRCTVQNVFDEDYQSYPSYPMPGRSVRVSAEVEY
ncbi:MAG: TonB-dependent receptor [Bacteroidota bacterium]